MDCALIVRSVGQKLGKSNIGLGLRKNTGLQCKSTTVCLLSRAVSALFVSLITLGEEDPIFTLIIAIKATRSGLFCVQIAIPE